MTPAARFADAMAGLWSDHSSANLGLAVSGGSDSIALMHLAAAVLPRERLKVATVDHGLRADSDVEAQQVGRVARALALSHSVLRWHGWERRGNLQDAARDARRRLLAEWAEAEGLGAIALGHTQDDQAETVLLRLARGSGVDGLAAMAPSTMAQGVIWLRPLLSFSREELRDWLASQGLGWIDDPSNDNPDFDRIKARQMLAHLEALGLTRARLVQTAEHMQQARVVLEAAAEQAAARIMREEHGDILFDAEALDALPQETRLRLVSRALCRISSAPYRPRLSALTAALSAPSATLHGCLITRHKGTLRLTREAQAVLGQHAPIGALWDNRWRVLPPEGAVTDGLQVAALGAAGLAFCPDRDAWSLPRRSLEASPAVWHGARLIAAPLAGFHPEWRAILQHPPAQALSRPHSH